MGHPYHTFKVILLKKYLGSDLEKKVFSAEAKGASMENGRTFYCQSMVLTGHSMVLTGHSMVLTHHSMVLTGHSMVLTGHCRVLTNSLGVTVSHLK